MTAHAQTKCRKSHDKSYAQDDMHSYESMKLFEIAIQMKKAGVSESFIFSAVRAASEYEGVSDLMNLWADEGDKKERDEIIADIQEMIDAISQKDNTTEVYIKFNDLEAIAKDIRGFKDSLYQIVIERGGVSKLAELTGIPQPSLSRFFNSNAMPRRSTMLAIANALNLDKLEIDLRWGK